MLEGRMPVNCLQIRVVVRFGKRAFPQGLKPHPFTGLIGAAEAAPFQSKCKLTHYTNTVAIGCRSVRRVRLRQTT